ncbi:MAG: hypothetical protein IJW83_00630 [Clostridia bacterium]|nr:hypothetical protein [Clostridia bacterium]
MENKAVVLTYRTADGNVLPIEYHETLTSTAALAREYARAGYPDRYCVFSEAQTDATLTGARATDGTATRGVFVSCILRPLFFPSQAAFLGELCAVALASALEMHTDRSIDIGWISDIFCEGKRIGGCALESKLDAFTAYEYLIVTFAVRVDERVFPCRLSDLMKQVFSDNRASAPLRMGESILDRFFSLCRELQTPKKFMDEYRRRFVMAGLPVVYLDGDKRKKGKILGVDQEHGQLLIEQKHGDIHKISGRSRLILPTRVHKRRR